MRIVFHETSWIGSRTGAASPTGRPPRPFGLHANGSRSVLGRSPSQRSALDASLPQVRSGRFESPAPTGPAAKAFGWPSAAGPVVVSQFATVVRLSYGTLDRRPRGGRDSPQVPQGISPALHQPVVGEAAYHAAKARTASSRTGRAKSPALAARGVAADKKSAARRRAHLVLIDESGFLMSPLVRRTLAPRGHTPILKTPGGRHEKVSVVAALTISPRRHRLGLYWRTFPQDFVNAERSAEFLRGLLRHLQGAVIVVWDGGPMHKGVPIAQLLADFPRLSLERLPPYAPDLNPVEYLWGHLKYGKLANLALTMSFTSTKSYASTWAAPAAARHGSTVSSAPPGYPSGKSNNTSAATTLRHYLPDSQ